MKRFIQRCTLLLFLSLTAFLAQPSIAAPITVTRSTNGIVQFALSGKQFVPVGVNYLVQHVGAPYQTFDMFDTKTFNIDTITQNLQQIRADGYTVIRLWLKGFDPDNGFCLSSGQISDTYVSNIRTTLEVARKLDLHVILTGAFKQGLWLPKNFLPSGATPGNDIVGGMNRLIMLPEMVEATGQFYHDLLVRIAEKDPTILDTIFYFDLYNELHFDLASAPFSKKAGRYDFGGHTYDLSKSASRQALMDDSAEAWFRAVGDKLKAVDPNLLFTASSFTLATASRKAFDGGIAPKPGATAFPVRPEIMMKGGAKILDFHIYPSPARSYLPAFHDRIQAAMGADGIGLGQAFPLPLIVGELGLAASPAFSHETALTELSATRSALCYYHFTGYVVWAWVAGNKDFLPADQALSRVASPRFNAMFCGTRIER